MRRALLAGVLTVACLVVVLPAVPATAVTPCSRGTMALTFDDGPHGTYTPQVLDILRGRKVTATFFQVGRLVSVRPAVTRRTQTDGHRVGNHSWNHENLATLGSSAVRDDLRRTNRAITDAGAAAPTLVRPPYGATNDAVRAAIGDLGMRQVLWNIDPEDWRSSRSAATIRTLVLDHLRDGGIVLLHDGVANSGSTVAALPGIIDGARARGYCIGTLNAKGTVTPPVPSARITDTEVMEGAAGTTTTVRSTVTLSTPTSRAVSVAYATADATALTGRDYTATSGTLTFAIGQTSQQVAVKVRGDALDEVNETFRVVLSRPSGVTLARSAATVRILDDDPPPTVGARNATVVEGASGTTTRVDIPVTLSAPSGRTITVDYATVDGTATAGRDHTAEAGTLTFSPGQTSRSVGVTVHGDALDEPNETFTLRLANPTRATIGRTTATVTITDDDPPPTIDLADATVLEGVLGATATVRVGVRLSAPSGRPISVAFSTVDGTAQAGSDHLAAAGTLALAPGQTAAQIAIVVLGDDVHEGDEHLTVVLSSPSRVLLGRATATVTVIDDDPAPPEPAPPPEPAATEPAAPEPTSPEPLPTGPAPLPTGTAPPPETEGPDVEGGTSGQVARDGRTKRDATRQ